MGRAAQAKPILRGCGNGRPRPFPQVLRDGLTLIRQQKIPRAGIFQSRHFGFVFQIHAR